MLSGRGEHDVHVGLSGAAATLSSLWLPKISSCAGADAAMGYPDGGMTDLLKLLGGFLVGLFRSQAAREAEMAFLRQQLFVLKRSAPARLRLRTAMTCPRGRIGSSRSPAPAFGGNCIVRRR